MFRRLRETVPAEMRALLALLVLAGQILGGALPPQARAMTVAGVRLVICHADGGGTTAPDAPADHGHDCALCPACLGAAPMALAAAPPPLARPAAILVATFAPKPGATGPPARADASPPPRGPPAQA